MRTLEVITLLVLSACDVVFRIDAVPLPDAKPEPCPATYDKVVGTANYRFVGYGDWVGADAECRNDSATAVTHLPVFADVGELDAFRMSLELPSGHVVHLGYARNLGDDPHRFFAVTGEELDEMSAMWAAGEPNGSLTATNQTVVMTTGESRMFDSLPNPSFGPSEYYCQCDGSRATLEFDVQ